jgi:hypothetical protein
MRASACRKPLDLWHDTQKGLAATAAVLSKWHPPAKCISSRDLATTWYRSHCPSLSFCGQNEGASGYPLFILFMPVNLPQEEDANSCPSHLLSRPVNLPQEEGAGGQPHALGWAVHREGQAGLLLRLYLAAPVAVKASRARCDNVKVSSSSLLVPATETSVQAAHMVGAGWMCWRQW